MNHNRSTMLICRGAVLLLLAATLSAVTGGQEEPKTALKKSTAIRHQVPDGTRTDNVAAARVDFLRRVVEKAAPDSVRLLQDSLSARNMPDSLKVLTLREVRNEAFDVGERLVFDVNYGFITAGEAVMNIAGFDTVAGRKCYRIEFRVNSLPSFSWIYRVEDRYLTYIDVETIAPWKFEQHVREGGYRRDFIAEFDQRRRIAKTSEGTYAIPAYVHDIMSAFYYARTVDFTPLKPGDRFTLYNFYKDTSYELAVKVLGRQELEVAAGTFRTIVVEPLVKEGGLFKSEGRIVIWLTDDERKIPIRVNTKVVIGSIDTELREYSGIRGPIQARLK